MCLVQLGYVFGYCVGGYYYDVDVVFVQSYYVIYLYLYQVLVQVVVVVGEQSVVYFDYLVCVLCYGVFFVFSKMMFVQGLQMIFML